MDLNRERWSAADYKEFFKYLQESGEDKYRKFSSALTPNTPQMLGVRVPILRKIAKEILKGDWRGFLALEKGNFHEEAIVEGLVMAGAKTDYAEMLENMKKFSAGIYNWAICDTVKFAGVNKYRAGFLKDVTWFLESENPWAVRMGILHLMAYYLDSEYISDVLEKVRAVKSDFYYVQMMQAWFLATAFVKCREETLAAFYDGGFSAEVMKMAARKIRDSYRVTENDKELVLQFKNI